MPTVIGRTVRAVPAEQTGEISLAWSAVSHLAPGFTDALRQRLICDLLGRLAAEKEQRLARNLDHWEDFAPVRITAIAEELLAERAEKVTAYLKANWEQWNTLAWRVTRNAVLVDLTMVRTAWELWEGRTEEDLSSRALVMNARELLRSRRRASRRFESLESMQSAAAARGEILDFPSRRLDDQDPLEILIAREEQRETDDELTYAIQNVRRRGNRWILRKGWWKSSGLAEVERTLNGTDFRGSGE